MKVPARSRLAVVQKLIQWVRSCHESVDESLFSILLRLEQQIRKDLKTKCRSQIKKQGSLELPNGQSPIILDHVMLSNLPFRERTGQAITMNFTARWKHKDGSTVEFSETGWNSDDPEKTAWLTRMNSLCSSVPAVAPGVRGWLQEYCELIEFSGLRSDLLPARSPNHYG